MDKMEGNGNAYKILDERPYGNRQPGEQNKNERINPLTQNGPMSTQT
jgi:hypothetical protein